MKLKGVGFFEAHIEKLLLGLMVAVAAGVVVLQFAGSPNDVNVRNQELPPARAYDPVERRAQEVDAQMSSTSIELPPVGERDSLLDGVSDRVTGAVSPRSRIMAMGTPAEIDEELFKGQAEDVVYAVVTPPAPALPVVASYAGTLDPALVSGNDELAAIVGPAQPFDIATVSVEVTYDGTALDDMFRAGGEGDARPIPINWRRNIEALGLRLERQEQMADGSWGATTTIDGLPGEQSLFALLQQEAADDMLGRDALASDARLAFEEAPSYRRPFPLRTIAGPEWKPPTVFRAELEAQGGADKQQQARRLLSQIASEERRKAPLQQQLEEEGRDQGDGRGSGRDPGRQDPGEETESRREIQLRRQIEQIDARIDSLKEQVRDLGYDPDTGEPIAVTGFSDETRDERLLEDDDARLWAHDATAEPGKTYRYRARLVVNNPMFGREPVLVEAQRPLAASPVVFSEPSPWSDAIVVAPRTAFFLASANDGRGGALGPGEPTASVEVFTFYYGFYRRSTLTLRPGELVSSEADLPDDLRLPLLAQGSDDDPDLAPVPPAGRRGGAEVIGSGGGPGGAGGQDPGEQGEPVPDKVPANIDVYLVDVTFEPTQAEGVGDRTTQAVAYFSQLGGQGLMRRVASTDRSGVLYQMLSKSAQDGQNQGQPQASIDVPDFEPRGPRREPSAEPGAPIGGGKGGGGG